MTDTNQKKEDEVLRRKLTSPPKLHKPTGLTPSKTKKPKPKEELGNLRKSLERPDFQKLELDIGRTPFKGK